MSRRTGIATEKDRHLLFTPFIVVGGLLFGFGLGLSQMARPEVVLDFLQFEDFGLLLVMGVGWGISDICPGAAYASVGIGNYPILLAIAGMFLGAYAQGPWRARPDDKSDATPTSD